MHTTRRLIAITTVYAFACLGATRTTSAQDRLIWSNIEVMPDDIIATPDAWTASRIEDLGGPSYRIAADDLHLEERIRVTRIVYYAVQFNAPEVLGHDWYLYEGDSSGPPGALLHASSDSPLDMEDTGWVNTAFDTPILRNTQRPEDLVLEPGHYFLAFRSIQAPNDDGKNSILTTRWANGDARAHWNFDVTADGNVGDRWYTMDEFNNIQDQEWAFELWGESVDTFSLSRPVPGRAGETNRLQAQDATPNAALALAVGLRDGATDIPNCPGVQVQISNAVLGGTARADATGTAIFTGFVPASAQGRRVLFQAFSPADCRISNLVEWTF